MKILQKPNLILASHGRLICSQTLSNPVALPVLYFYWSLYPEAAIVISGGFIVSIL